MIQLIDEQVLVKKQRKFNVEQSIQQISSMEIQPEEFSLSQLQEIWQTVFNSKNLELQIKKNLLNRVKNRIIELKLISQIKKLESTVLDCLMKVNQVAQHGNIIENIENYLTRQTPRYIKIVRWIAFIIILIGVIVGGVALLDSQNTQLALGCGIVIIITGFVQLFLEVYNRCSEKAYKRIPKKQKRDDPET